MDYHELEKTTVVQLREMLKEYPDVKGASGMLKEQLVSALADRMGIEEPHKVIVGIDKLQIKDQIRALKQERGQAREAKDRAKLKIVRRKIHRLRRRLRKATKVK